MQTLSSASKYLSAHTPEILCGIGVAGVVTTSVLSANAAIKATERIRECGAQDDTPREKLRLTWDLYIPPVVAGAGTVSAILGLHNIGAGRAAAAFAASTIARDNLRDYRAAVVRTLGKDTDRKIRDSVAEDKVKRKDPSTVILSEGGKITCLDLYSGRAFSSTPEELHRAVNNLNYILLRDGFVSLSEFYDAVGLERTELSDRLGWNQPNEIELDLSSQLMADQRPVLAIGFTIEPRDSFYKTY